MRFLACIKLTVIVAGMLLLCACTTFEPTTEKLLLPPRLTQQQSELHDALESALGTSKFTLKYPKSGQYRSAFVFSDVDNDGVEEAFVFYQTTGKGSNTWINILDFVDGRWISVYDVAGEGSNVDFVSFANVTGEQHKSLIVGWSEPQVNSKTLSIFDYADNMLKEVFWEQYDQYAIFDANSDGLDEIALITTNSTQGKSYLDLVGLNDGDLDIQGSITLNKGISKFAQVLSGKINSITPALFIDEYLDENTLVTEVFAVNDFTFTNLLRPDKDTNNSALTLRSTSALCKDIDGDGIIEIPTISLLPGYVEGLNEKDTHYLTQYNRLDNFTLRPILSGCINELHGYMIIFPPEWVDTVTLIDQPESGEWRFVEYASSLEDSTEVLLRIRVYSQNDYHDKFESAVFTLLRQKGLFEYYSSIPPNNSTLAISAKELAAMFALTS